MGRRWVAPDRGAIETQVDATRYRGSIFEAHPAHERALRDAGYFPASLGGVATSGGHTCSACGFRSWFRDCSRCRDRAHAAA